MELGVAERVERHPHPAAAANRAVGVFEEDPDQVGPQTGRNAVDRRALVVEPKPEDLGVRPRGVGHGSDRVGIPALDQEVHHVLRAGRLLVHALGGQTTQAFSICSGV